MDMSTPLVPEVIPEIDANPMTFLGGGGYKCKRVGEVIRQTEQLLNFKCVTQSTATSNCQENMKQFVKC